MPQFGPEVLAIGVIWYIVFLFSTVCHEGAHALAAKLGGDPTASHGGQVSLNPMPHILREPVGMVLAPLASLVFTGGKWAIGWASAPYDPLWAQRYPRRAAAMSLAGPLANFTLMLLAAGAIHGGIAMGYFQPPQIADYTRITEAVEPAGSAFAATFLSVLFSLNLILGTFNLLPVPPLDGHSGITLLMPVRAGQRWLEMTQDPTMRLAGLLLAWYAFGRILEQVFPFALNALYPGANYR